MLKVIITFLLFLVYLYAVPYTLSPVQAVADPLNVVNNKFGIHIISATDNEASEAAQLVNSSGGDWGYITVLIESKDRNHDKWQLFFNELRRRHLIPIVRLATKPDGGIWTLPYSGEERAWADFLNSLIWPTKNRYVVVYNEPNQGQEWAGKADPQSYAKVLDQTITALKSTSEDFFVMNSGFDASSPTKLPMYEDEETYLTEMEKAVPGIFNKLDGWVSHSYPNPGFAGLPTDSGRGTVMTWAWEMEKLYSLGLTKKLPIFITETGWKHAEGLSFDRFLPSADKVGDYYQESYQAAWNNSQIVAVTPFLLNYQEIPFDHFSFKKLTDDKFDLKTLGIGFPNFYSSYQKIMDLPKIKGNPIQTSQAVLSKGEVYSTLVAGESYLIPLTIKNTGQSIWNEQTPWQAKFINGQTSLQASFDNLTKDNIEPNQSVRLLLHLKAPLQGKYQLAFQFYNGEKAFDSFPFQYDIQIKSPVILTVSASLMFQNDVSGSYSLAAKSYVQDFTVPITLNSSGISDQIEAKYLLPDYDFEFTLAKPYYQPKTINVRVVSGKNLLNFGTLKLDLWQVLTHPKSWLKILPFRK